MLSIRQLPGTLILVGILNLAIAPTSVAQTDTKPPAGWPHLLGDHKTDLSAAVRQRLVYPPEVMRDHITGYVYVSFKIDADGSVKDVRIHEGLQPDCDGAAMRAVRQLPPVEPLQEAGKPVASYLITIVKFDWRTKPLASK
jgi:TonB family protein